LFEITDSSTVEDMLQKELFKVVEIVSC